VRISRIPHAPYSRPVPALFNVAVFFLSLGPIPARKSLQIAICTHSTINKAIVHALKL